MDNADVAGYGTPFVTTEKGDLHYFGSKNNFRAPTKIASLKSLQKYVKTLVMSMDSRGSMEGALLAIATYQQRAAHPVGFKGCTESYLGRMPVRRGSTRLSAFVDVHTPCTSAHQREGHRDGGQSV